MLAELLATTAAAMPLPDWRPDIAGARAYAASRRGEVTFAVRVGDRLDGHRPDRIAPSASTLKLLLMATHLRNVQSRALTRADRELLAPMIRRSANPPADALVVRHGPRIARTARAAGMRRFALRAPWGMSDVSARDLTRLALGLPELLPARHRAYGLRLLRTVVPSQRWGIGQVAPRGWRLHLKGGWGSGTGRVDHQVALLTRGEERVAVAILTTAQGSHRYGKATLRGVAQRLLRGLAATCRRPCSPSS